MPTPVNITNIPINDCMFIDSFKYKYAPNVDITIGIVDHAIMTTWRFIYTFIVCRI